MIKSDNKTSLGLHGDNIGSDFDFRYTKVKCLEDVWPFSDV